MKGQILSLFICLGTLVGVGFTHAQDNIFQEYIKSRAKPATLTQWMNNLPEDPTSNIATFRPPQQLLKGGDMLTDSYVTVLRRQSDVLRITIDEYRSAMTDSLSISAAGGVASVCQGLTNQDIIKLMSRAPDFITMITNYPYIALENYNDSDVDRACTLRAACVGGSMNNQVNQRSSGQHTWPLCSSTLTSKLLMLYQDKLNSITIQDPNRYTALFVNGSGGDSIFDIAIDMTELASMTQSKTPLPVDITTIEDDTSLSAATSLLPDEMIASTEQLVNLLQVATTIDPRQDDQINSLINKLTTVTSTTATIPTGSILNACISPNLVDNNTSLLQQLRNTQQTIQEYNRTTNTDQTLNQVINGQVRPQDLAQPALNLSAINTPGRSVGNTMVSDLSANPLGAELSAINEEDLPTSEGPGNSIGNISGPLGGSGTTKGGPDTLRQCLGSCTIQYDTSQESSCISTCESKGEIGGILNLRACKQQCFNAKIACKASCLCDSTSAIAIDKEGSEEISKLHQNFEARWCLVPTNKLRNPIHTTCMRVDPTTGISKSPSIQCLLETLVGYGEYSRESGKQGTRVNPRERFELPSKLDLATMIRFPIAIVSRAIRNNAEKKSDIQRSLYEQSITNDIVVDPNITATKNIGSSFEQINAFTQEQNKLFDEITQQATNTQGSLTSP